MRPFSVEAAAVVEAAVDGSAGQITTEDMAAAFAAARTITGGDDADAQVLPDIALSQPKEDDCTLFGMHTLGAGSKSINGSSPLVGSIPQIIGTVNGQQWLNRWERMKKFSMPAIVRQHTNLNQQNCNTDLTGSGVYTREVNGQEETRYDIVNSWQVNYVRGTCTLEGSLLEVDMECYNDEVLFKDFHSNRPGSMVLDVGCNTGKNMTRALQYGGPGTEAFGIEYSSDSLAIACAAHGADHAFQGDASTNFVDEHSWAGKFSVVQCTAVLQHMTPQQVQSALHNMSRCLVPGGELLLTFKDAPTRQQMSKYGMSAWADEVFTADILSQEYLRNGYLQAVMWDDDYYPGLTSKQPPLERDLSLPGLHRREFVFYGLEWMKSEAMKHGLLAERVEVLPDSKIPRSALHWMVIFRLSASAPCTGQQV
jgi:SAM-dependent methyltransferase